LQIEFKYSLQELFFATGHAYNVANHILNIISTCIVCYFPMERHLYVKMLKG